MFDRYKRNSKGQFAPDMRGKNHPPSPSEAREVLSSPEWRRSAHTLKALTPAGVDLQFLPITRNRNPKSGYFDGLVRVYGLTFELKAKKGPTGAYKPELHTTGFGRNTHITSREHLTRLLQQQTNKNFGR